MTVVLQSPFPQENQERLDYSLQREMGFVGSFFRLLLEGDGRASTSSRFIICVGQDRAKPYCCLEVWSLVETELSVNANLTLG